ncbi:hypothetical protein B1964_28500 [Gordonia sp. i37]|nr:hypothetical protein B1964_28500 [Gordonia sp. i37]
MARGIDAPLEDVAREAGVSIGTLYNHYRNRECLLDEVLPMAAQAQWDRIRAAVAQSNGPAERFERYLVTLFDVQRTDRLLSDVLSTPVPLPDQVANSCAQVMELGATLLTDTHEAGYHTAFASADALTALIQANSVVHRSGAPLGWEEFLRSVATPYRRPAESA